MRRNAQRVPKTLWQGLSLVWVGKTLAVHVAARQAPGLCGEHSAGWPYVAHWTDRLLSAGDAQSWGAADCS